jgi:GR25 family glycosyltransferase involved in LPS biosynthesis
MGLASILSVAAVRGFCINLPAQQRRRERVLQHLQSLELPGRYQLFEARCGDPDPAPRRGLSRGEDGLWRSVLALLEQLLQPGALEDVDLVHILEDDVELSPQFCRWLGALDLSALRDDLDLLFTDMYAGPTVFPNRHAFFEDAFATNQLRWLAGNEYTGCTSSWLIPAGRLQRVQALLQGAYAQPRPIPIDNLLRQLLLAGELQGVISVPFLTSIDLQSQALSAIQDQSEQAVAVTARVADRLRRHLSVLRQPDDLADLLPLLAQLLPAERLSAHLGQLVAAVQAERGFKYSYDPRLLDQAGNPQANSPQTARARARSASGL